MHETLKMLSELKLNTCINQEDKERYQLINNILQDQNCFKKMKTETAYNLLTDLDFTKEEVKKIYNELIFND